MSSMCTKHALVMAGSFSIEHLEFVILVLLSVCLLCKLDLQMLIKWSIDLCFPPSFPSPLSSSLFPLSSFYSSWFESYQITDWGKLVVYTLFISLSLACLKHVNCYYSYVTDSSLHSISCCCVDCSLAAVIAYWVKCHSIPPTSFSLSCGYLY